MTTQAKKSKSLLLPKAVVISIVAGIGYLVFSLLVDTKAGNRQSAGYLRPESISQVSGA